MLQVYILNYHFPYSVTMAKDAMVPLPLTQADTGLQQGTFWGDTKLLTHNIQKDPKKKNQINTMLFKLYEEEKGKNKILGVGVL